MQTQTSFSVQLNQLYEKLTTCIQSFHQSQLTIKHLKYVDEIARESLPLVRSNPDAFFAQLQLPKKHLTYRANLTFNCLCLVMLLSKLHRWNESSLHQLICAAITSFVHQQVLLEKSYLTKEVPSFSRLNQGSARLIKLTELAKQHIWHNGSKNEQAVHGLNGIKLIKTLDKIPFERQILFISRWLSIQITPSKRLPHRPLSQIIQSLATIIPTNCYGLISPFMQYPSLCPPGSIIKTNKGMLYWVLSISKDSLTVRAYDRATGQCATDIEQLLPHDVIKAYPSKVIHDMNIIDSLWNEDWEEAYSDSSLVNQLMPVNYRVDKPPALLLAIQDQLNKAEVDIDRVCGFIAKEPAFCQYLQLTASKNSRQQLPVDNVKHAIMIHGLGRAQSILTQQALTLRLTQNTFPLLPIISQFTALARAFSEHIADNVPLFLPEEASTFISFVCASLYTDVRFKRMVFEQKTPNKTLRALVTPSQNPSFLEHAKKLSHTWQQDKMSLKTINHLQNTSTKSKAPKQVKTLAAITQLSLAMTRLHLLSRTEDDINISNQAKTSLGLDNTAFNRIQALATSTLYSPLY